MKERAQDALAKLPVRDKTPGEPALSLRAKIIDLMSHFIDVNDVETFEVNDRSRFHTTGPEAAPERVLIN